MTSRKRRLRCIALGLGVLLSSPLAAAAADSPAACPPSPMRVVRSVGGATEYGGSYAGIPELCLLKRSDGAGYFYFGVWRTDWPGAGDAYPALKTAVQGTNGTRTSFVTRSYPGLQWTDSIINQGIETLVVDGRSYRVLRLAHEREGIEGNTYHSIITFWRDVRTGATLKVFEDQISGQSYGPATTWTAVQVEPLR